MKSIKEKQMLVKWAKAMGTPIDPLIVEEVENHERLMDKVRHSVRSNLSEDLKAAATKPAEQTQPKPSYDVPPTLDEVLSLFEETVEQVTEEVIQSTPEINHETEKSIIDLAVSKITEEEVRNKDSFQQPNPAPVDKNINDIQKKLRFLEQAIGRIAAHGPGSGEVRFRFLDDFVSNSYDRDRHKILKIVPADNPAYDKVGFGFLTGDQGPIYSMKYDTVGYTSNANVAAGLTAWNPVEDCLDVHQSNNTATQVGLEHCVRVTNHNVSTLYQGNVIYYTGANGDGNPTGHLFTANITSDPRLVVGIATEDIPVGFTGRVTVYGKVRTLNTTGSQYGETWYEGNVVYAHPAIPGGLTINRPAAPNVAVLMGIVTHKDTANGIILTRTTPLGRTSYGNFANTKSAAFSAPNLPHLIHYDKVSISSDVYVPSSNTARLVANISGLYNFQFSNQYVSTTASAEKVYIWARKNGVDIPDSGTIVTINSNGAYFAPAWNFVESLNAGEYFELVHAVSSTNISLKGGTEVAFMPNIPSVLMSVTQVS